MLNGFKSDEPIQSRTNDLSDWNGTDLLKGRLLFGDGQARGLAAWFAWHILKEHILSEGFLPTPGVERVFRSLLKIPVAFRSRRAGLSHHALIVDCAVTQNVKAQTQQPLNTMEWCHLILSLTRGTRVEELLQWTRLRREGTPIKLCCVQWIAS